MFILHNVKGKDYGDSNANLFITLTEDEYNKFLTTYADYLETDESENINLCFNNLPDELKNSASQIYFELYNNKLQQNSEMQQ